jgi:hypothetical protein
MARLLINNDRGSKLPARFMENMEATSKNTRRISLVL